eukprot:Skav203704  [mRNA]  locus=scaffold259:438950:439516:+ [translate_table: standard]
MADISEEHRKLAVAASQSARVSINAARQVACPTAIRVQMRDWCIGSRQCHTTCMLRQFYSETGDDHFSHQAIRCAGRCVAWELCQREDAQEWWHGWPFVRNPHIDMTILGLHARQCPLNGQRNVREPFLSLRCGAIVLDGSQKLLAKADRSLQSDFEIETSLADLKDVLPSLKNEHERVGFSFLASLF